MAGTIKNIRTVRNTKGILQYSKISGKNSFKDVRTLFTIADLTNRKKEYVKKEIMGYTMQQMYDVVSDVQNYNKFVPYVKKSLVHSRKTNNFKADLIVGFPPLNERYTSHVTLIRPTHVRSVCNDGRIFNFLLNDWKFSPGLKDIPQSCVVDFQVTFEFKSILHTQIAHIFFEFVCDQMEKAFVQEAARRYGQPGIRNCVLASHRT